MGLTQEERLREFNIVCKSIEFGESATSVLRAPDTISSATFYKWIKEDEAMAEEYARVCAIRADLIAEEILQISDTPQIGEEITTNDKIGKQVKTRDMLGHRRLQVDARKWYLSKLAPKKYGDRIAVDTEVQNTILVKNVSKQFPDEK